MPKLGKRKVIDIGEEEEVTERGDILTARERKERIVIIDPTLLMDRFLHYRERHTGWNIFRFLYWSVYLIVVSILLLYYDELGLTITLFFGAIIMILAVMLILFGLTEALHSKFLKKYG